MHSKTSVLIILTQILLVFVISKYNQPTFLQMSSPKGNLCYSYCRIIHRRAAISVNRRIIKAIGHFFHRSHICCHIHRVIQRYSTQYKLCVVCNNCNKKLLNMAVYLFSFKLPQRYSNDFNTD